MLESVTYVSRARLSGRPGMREVERIVDASRRNNPAAGITGGLIFTELHFAQVLEGQNNALDALLARIASDPRHDMMAIVERRPIEGRRFGHWAMAYSGPSFYIDRHVRPLIDAHRDGAPTDAAAAYLAELARQFVALRTASEESGGAR